MTLSHALLVELDRADELAHLHLHAIEADEGVQLQNQLGSGALRHPNVVRARLATALLWCRRNIGGRFINLDNVEICI